MIDFCFRSNLERWDTEPIECHGHGTVAGCPEEYRGKYGCMWMPVRRRRQLRSETRRDAAEVDLPWLEMEDSMCWAFIILISHQWTLRHIWFHDMFCIVWSCCVYSMNRNIARFGAARSLEGVPSCGYRKIRMQMWMLETQPRLGCSDFGQHLAVNCEVRQAIKSDSHKPTFFDSKLSGWK